MELLTSPLSQWAALQQTGYAEWAGVRAKIALLMAHAQCATLRAAAGQEEDLCGSIVERAQAPFRSGRLAPQALCGKRVLCAGSCSDDWPWRCAAPAHMIGLGASLLPLFCMSNPCTCAM
jgi:hypothetical protein